MLDNQQYAASGELERPQALLLQAIWALEKASTIHEKLAEKSRKSTSHPQDIERVAALIRHNIKRSLENLSHLHLSLFGCQLLDSSEISFQFTNRTVVRRQSGQPGVDPRILQLQNLLKCLSGNPVNLTMTQPDINSKPEFELMSDEENTDFVEIMQSLGEKEAPRVDVQVLEEEVAMVEPLPTANAPELEPSEALMCRISAKTFDLSSSLKQIRQYFVRKYEAGPAGIPFALVELLDSCEKQFCLKRNTTTDSIWNIDHQRQRKLIFDETNIGIAYRQKCICVVEGPLTSAVHRLDLHCPRNIPEKDDKLEWDEDAQEWVKKKTPRPNSPVNDDPEVDEDEAEEEEEEEKEETNEEKMEKAIAGITEMVGLDKMKEHIQKLKAMIETSTRQGVDLKQERFGTVIMGNPGTGKTAFARQYAKYLCASGVVGGSHFVETTGAHIASGGISRAESHMDDIEREGGGVLFVDEAHHMVNSSHQCGGKRTLDFMLGEVERRIGKVIYVLVGPEKEMRKLLGRGSGNAGSLLPYIFKFPDYSDEELLSLLASCIKKKFDGKMNVEGGLDGVYLRIAARRLGRNRGKTQFDNARAVENLFAQIWERQSIRREQALKEKAEKRKVEEAAKEKDDSKDGPVPSTDNATKHVAEDIQEAVENIISTDDTKAQDPKKTSEIEHTTEEKKVEGAAEKSTNGKEDPATEGSTSDEATKPSDNTENAEDTAEKTDPEDYIFTKEDILGPVPSDAILESPAWKQLQRLTGLKTVKDSILNILQLSKTNYQRELEEKPLLELSFNRLFLGPPGTGKTVVAKLYGQILAEIGVLSKGELIVRNPTDLIGKYIGHSEANTKAALSSAIGNVLVIDEAYMMYGGEGKSGGSADVFRQAIIDTLVSEVQSVPGEDRCVLLLGYADQMQEMLQNCNPGLSRRFPLADAFWFHDFTMEELESILRTKLEDNCLDASEEAIKVAMDVLDKARSRLNFGNGGEVENIITRAKTNYQSRIAEIPIHQRPESWILEPQDFDPEFDRGKNATLNLHKLFSDVVGCEAIVSKLEQYQKVSQAMKLKNMDPKNFIPTSFVFKGPPGTGKTTTARKIAQVYYDMGFLSEPSVVECSASDLIAKYCGQSGPKTVKALERGLGKVLFIDEAYRLAHGSENNSFASEVVSELVDCLTKPKFFGKIIVILAGYENEMNHLLSINPGLASRFPEEIHFPSMSSTHALKMLKIKLKATEISIPVLDQPKSMDYKNLIRLMGLLAGTPSWGNGRDVETLAKTLCRLVFMNIGKAEDELICTVEMVTSTMGDLLQERRARTVKSC